MCKGLGCGLPGSWKIDERCKSGIELNCRRGAKKDECISRRPDDDDGKEEEAEERGDEGHCIGGEEREKYRRVPSVGDDVAAVVAPGIAEGRRGGAGRG